MQQSTLMNLNGTMQKLWYMKLLLPEQFSFLTESCVQTVNVSMGLAKSVRGCQDDTEVNKCVLCVFVFVCV